jgi:hypothetical protein
MTRTPDQAVATEAEWASQGTQFGVGQCLGVTVQAYALTGQTGYDTPADAHAAVKHHGSGVAPLGAPLWWVGGKSGAGHICLADGAGGCYSTDFTDDGYVGDGKVHHLSNANNITVHDTFLAYQGWSYDLEGVIVVEMEDWLDMATQQEVQQAFYDALVQFMKDHGAQMFSAAAGNANQLVPNPLPGLSYPTHTK